MAAIPINESFMLARIVFLAALCAVPNLAAAKTYNCTFRVSGPVKVIPSQVRIQVAPDGASATVLDGLIERENGGPLQARFFKETNSLLRVRWRLENVLSKSGQKATLDYTWSIERRATALT